MGSKNPAGQEASSPCTVVNSITLSPSDAIMDMLGSEECRMAILDHYNRSQEPIAVFTAVEMSKTAAENTKQKRRE